MLGRFANRYTARRDSEVWGRIEGVWPTALVPFKPVSWLHALESREPPRSDGPVRGVLLGSTQFLFFDAGDWMEWFPIVRFVGLDWLEDGSQLTIRVADPDQREVAWSHCFNLDVPGQGSGSGEALRHKFIGTLVDICQARADITVDDLWPLDGRPGLGLDQIPR